MNYRLTIMFFFFTPLIFGQTNLVPNPSFETLDTCPTSIGQLNNALPWFSPNIPPICPGGTSDYFNECNTGSAGVPVNSFGNEPARTGVAYSGFYTMNLPFENNQEYIEVPLLDSLAVGEKYIVSFYVSLAEVMGFATNKIGAYFSDTAIINACDTLLPFIPQIQNAPTNQLTNKNVWTCISDTFTAHGGEAFMIIGNFNTLEQSDTVYVGGGTWGNTCCSYYYIDDVSVIMFDSLSGLDNINNLFPIKIFPNPATNELTAHLTIPDKYYFDLFDLIGTKRLSAILDNSSKTVDLTSIDSGVYVFTIVDGKGDIIKTDKLIIIK